MLYYGHMQPHTQQDTGEQEGFYHPAQASPYQTGPTQDNAGFAAAPAFDDAEVVTWDASEYIHRSKDFPWIAGFAGIVVVILGISIFFQQWILVALVVIMAITMGVFAFRPPKVKHYTLSHQGLRIDDRMYHISDFRSFGVLAEDAFYSIVLIPIKRFMPAVTVYFAQEDGERIVDILSSHLPLEDLQPDPIDAIMRRLHF
jgi:hypothetical protein